MCAQAPDAFRNCRNVKLSIERRTGGTKRTYYASYLPPFGSLKMNQPLRARQFFKQGVPTVLTGAVFGFSMAAAIAQTLQIQHAGPPPAAAAARQSGVAMRDADWQDAARQRLVPVRIYLPAALETPSTSASAAKLPLVVFSHGLGGSRFGYSHLGQHLAQNGFVALHLQHAGSDRAVWQGGPLSVLGNVQSAASEANALARAQDVSFVITTLLADTEIGSRIDPRAIAVAGHSYGANTAMLVAGASVERDGKWISFTDARIKAAILLSAPPFHGEGDQAAVLRGIQLPTLHVTGTEDVIRVPGYGSDVTDRIAVFRDTPAAPPGKKYLAVFEGGEHSVFTDRTRSERALAIKSATRDLALAFLRATLQSKSGAMEAALALAKPLLVEPERLLARRLEAHFRQNSP